MKDQLYTEVEWEERDEPIIDRYIQEDNKIEKGGKNNMANLKNEALAYESPQTKNIAELDKVPVELEVSEKVFKEGTDDEFKIKTIEVEGVDYRVPVSVLESLKVMLEDNPNMKYFKVKKDGEGMKTNYTVIPLLE